MHRPALEPEDLARFFVERANAGDLDGLVALYEPGAVVARSNGSVAVGADEIRALYARMLARKSHFEPVTQAPALRNGDIALTSAVLSDGATSAEIARRQPDGSWLWIVDHPILARAK